ncbi:MAG: 3',5'-cyclic-nucleotide phosphodiesterase [Rhodocyclaceae bacterium]|nr:3',5'-cyclic-nucleotide phosphodiesterase [Rhodocyclaceae bacterium]
MKVRILGCSGGIGGRHLRTTSMLVDNDVLIDAGTGVGDLSIAELVLIDHVFLTHSHLDHICCLPFIVDTVGEMRDKPLTVHATDATLEILRSHLFNWSIWPDFTEIPKPEEPFLRYEPIKLGQVVNINQRAFRVLPARHTVPAVGYALEGPNHTLAFSGDTTTCDEFWHAVNRLPRLRYLVIETAFSNREKMLAIASKHLCPDMLKEELAKMRGDPEIFITHLKPGQIELTMRELAECVGDYKPRMLQNNQVFEL